MKVKKKKIKQNKTRLFKKRSTAYLTNQQTNPAPKHHKQLFANGVWVIKTSFSSCSNWLHTLSFSLTLQSWLPIRQHTQCDVTHRHNSVIVLQKYKSNQHYSQLLWVRTHILSLVRRAQQSFSHMMLETLITAFTIRGGKRFCVLSASQWQWAF